MIYYAQRASPFYRKSLHQIAKSKESYHILSVIGGLSFLHALNPALKSLILIDPDCDAHDYCRMVLTLLDKSKSGEEFFALLTGRHVKKNWWERDSFGEPIEISSQLGHYLEDPVMISLYQRTYGKMNFDADKLQGTIEDSTIKFFDFDLTPMTFSWGIGTGNFTNEDTFQELKRALKNISPIYIQARFEDADLTNLLATLEGGVFLLASNTESPLFSETDVIFRKIQREAPRELRYISWIRNMQILPHKDNKQEGQVTLKKLLADDNVFSLAALFGESNALPEISPTATIFKNIEELKELRHYGWGTFFVCYQDIHLKYSSTLLRDVINALVPCYSKIIFWGNASASSLLSVLEECEFQKSYDLTSLSWYGDFVLSIWELRGRVIKSSGSIIL